MTTLRAQVSLPNLNGIPADTVTNTWHFLGNTVDPLDAANSVLTDITDFYAAVDGVLASCLGTTATLKIYDLEDPEPRVPILTDTFTLSLGAGAPLPHEVACVLSFNATLVSGASQARRRGRIFLGPLDSSVMDESGGQSVIQSGVCELIGEAADALIAAGSGISRQWCVFSPTTAGAPPWSAGEILAASAVVVGGYVDNAFDTVRSRGTLATSRFIVTGVI